MDSAPALDISSLHAWHGDNAHVLRGLDLRVSPGQAVMLGGERSQDRACALHAILGLTARRQGSVRIRGTESIALPAEQIAELGVGYCPALHGMLPGLSCEENLLLPPASTALGGGMPLTDIYDLLPALYAHRHTEGAHLPKDEQRLLAVARILRTGADILLFEGLAASLSPEGVQALCHMIPALKTRGYAIVMAERDTRFAAPFADEVCVMEQGRIVGCSGCAKRAPPLPLSPPLVS